MASAVSPKRTRLRSLTRRSFALLLGGVVLSACTSAAPTPAAPPGAALPTVAATTPATKTAASPNATGSPTAARATAELVQQVVKLEQMRGHLVAAAANAQVGKTDLAKLHAEHPVKEDFPTLEANLRAKDPARAAKAQQTLADDLKLFESQPSQPQLEAAVAEADRVLDEVRLAIIPPAMAGDLAFQAFDEGWGRIEDGVRAKSRDQYRSIEDAMGDVGATLLKPETPDSAKALAALQKLDETVDAALPALR